MIDPRELNDYDYEILDAVYKRKRVREDEIPSLLSRRDAEATKLRIKRLLEYDVIAPGYNGKPKMHTSYLLQIYETRLNDFGKEQSFYTGYVKLDALGIRALEDYKLAKKKEWNENFLKWTTVAIMIASLLVSVTSVIVSAKTAGWP